MGMAHGGDFRVEGRAGGFQGLAGVKQQADDVIRNSRNRQTFDRGLQPPLQLLTTGGFFQPQLVLYFGGNGR